MSNSTQRFDGAKMLGALQLANPVTLTSASGVLTLSPDSNSFIAEGMEAITGIVGGAEVTQGIYVITWNSGRVLTYNASTLRLIGQADRTTASGDVGIYQLGGGVTTEIVYMPVSGYAQATIVPAGVIAMWSGSIASIPSGWALCNGSNGTPDLRDRFIVGAGNGYSVGVAGGEATHALTVAEMPSHSHTANLPIGFVDTSAGTYVDRAEDYNYTMGIGTSSVGGGVAHNNLPPYYALAYIMKL